MMFDSIEYLRDGNDKQKAAFRTLTENNIIHKLQYFSPILTGTIPINIDTSESDLDIICSWGQKADFVKTLKKEFSQLASFTLADIKINDRDTILASFRLGTFKMEIFGQNRPVKQQEAFRHMVIEYEILQAYGESFRQEIVRLKQEGMKTEPAFAKLLGIDGDPYKELLHYKV